MQPWARRLGKLGELGEPVGGENDRTHRPIVGRCVQPAALPVQANGEGDEQAGGDAADQGLAGLARADEHGQQLLPRGCRGCRPAVAG